VCAVLFISTMCARLREKAPYLAEHCLQVVCENLEKTLRCSFAAAATTSAAAAAAATHKKTLYGCERGTERHRESVCV
jgi:hypothetical protein